MTAIMRFTVTRKPLQQTEAPPIMTRRTEDGTLFIDFGKAAFGTLLVPSGKHSKMSNIAVHLGEQLASESRLEREPVPSIRYIRVEQQLDRNKDFTRIVIPPAKNNTGPASVKMPPDIGEVFPFRYAEIENAEKTDATATRQIRVHYPFDDAASSFDSPDTILNAVWDLCKYSIKATSFCGIYVDGDRERIPYEGDAYINQLGHYNVDSEYELARYTHEYLIQNPTWPAEWNMHSVMMAWADYMYTGETDSLVAFYEDLCVKTLIGLARKDGLISTQSELCSTDFEKRLNLHNDSYDHVFGCGLRDLVDWPPRSSASETGERDNHEMLPINTVVNAFHCHVLRLMTLIANVLGYSEDAARFRKQAEAAADTINRLLFDQSRGVYVDGEGSRHSSLHSNMFMLAFNLVPGARKAPVLSFVKSRGMACSVYGAQHLLEALYSNGEEQHALELMAAKHDRSWWNMIRIGSTITTEAWDPKYKNNLDWNHAWGAAPANIIPRFVLGVRPLQPGFRKVLINPQPGSLDRVSGTVPTIHGPVSVALESLEPGIRRMKVQIPEGIEATIGLRHASAARSSVTFDGKETPGHFKNGHIFVYDIHPGTHELIYKCNYSCARPRRSRT